MSRCDSYLIYVQPRYFSGFQGLLDASRDSLVERFNQKLESVAEAVLMLGRRMEQYAPTPEPGGTDSNFVSSVQGEELVADKWARLVGLLSTRVLDDIDLYDDEYDSCLTMPSDPSDGVFAARRRCLSRPLRRGTFGAHVDLGQWFDASFAFWVNLKVYNFHAKSRLVRVGVAPLGGDQNEPACRTQRGASGKM